MLNNKVALITGASRGIGKSIAIELAKNGINIVINYKSNELEAKKTEQEIKENYNVKTLLIKADVSDEQEVKEMVETIINEFGKIDILINNAGIAIDNIFEYKTKEEFEKVLSTNLIGPFLTSKYVSRYMLEVFRIYKTK